MDEEFARRVSQLVEISDPQSVEITISADGRVWVNIDEVCRLRIHGATRIRIDDHRAIVGGVVSPGYEEHYGELTDN